MEHLNAPPNAAVLEAAPLFERNGAPSQPTPSVYQQTGWKRPHPQTVCQDPDILMRIWTLDYKLTKDFVKYFEARSGVRLSQCDCGFKYVAELLANPQQPASVLPVHWHLTRAKLQDCWELFTTNRDPSLVNRTISLRDEGLQERWESLKEPKRTIEKENENDFLAFYN